MLFPIPSNEFVKSYFPWNAGGWHGFNEFIPYKEVIATDVFRQQLPWIKLSIEQIKNGNWPLWNPYNFSGNPLLANIQSHNFYPLNILFYIFSLIPAWIIFILITPLLSALFMYLFMREIKTSKIGSIFSATSFALMPFQILWLEWGFIPQALMWLPMILWTIEKISKTKKWFFYYLLTFLFYCEITSGYWQLVILVIIISLFYVLFKGKKYLLSFIICLLISLILAAVQIISSIEIYLHSARNIASFDFFQKYLFPLSHLVTIFVPDFFGNFATRNYWGQNYHEFMAYAGITVFIFALFAVFIGFKKSRQIKFWTLLAVISLMFALPTPFAFFPFYLKIPILSSGIPARWIALFQISMVVLGGIGINKIQNSPPTTGQAKFKIIFLTLGLIYALLWAIVIFSPQIWPEGWGVKYLDISKRNLILPTSVFLSTALITLLIFRLKRFILLFFIFYFLISILELGYFAQKWLPLGRIEYIFPEHPMIKFLQDQPDFYRFYGQGNAQFDHNFATYYRIFSAEGYDSLYIRRYGELLSSTENGLLEKEKTKRSDAVFSLKDTFFRKRLFNLLGVKFILQRKDFFQQEKDFDISNYENKGKYQLIWEKDNIRIYENKEVYPRAFLMEDFIVKKDDAEIIENLFDSKIDLRKTAVLEEKLPQEFIPGKVLDGKVKIVDYRPNKIVININAKNNNLLFLSDSYFPGWKAYLDSEETKIYRANYNFRAVPVSAGNHRLIFSYEPSSFQLGLKISLITWLIFTGSFVIITVNTFRKNEKKKE